MNLNNSNNNNKMETLIRKIIITKKTIKIKMKFKIKNKNKIKINNSNKKQMNKIKKIIYDFISHFMLKKCFNIYF